MQLQTGQTCQPTCSNGYHAEASLTLACFQLTAGNSTRYMFDATGARCMPNTCEGGAEGVTDAAVYSKCNQRRTGEMCEASDIHCGPGFRPTDGALQLVCDANGRYSAWGLYCEVEARSVPPGDEISPAAWAVPSILGGILLGVALGFFIRGWKDQRGKPRNMKEDEYAPMEAVQMRTTPAGSVLNVGASVSSLQGSTSHGISERPSHSHVQMAM